jgi:hypothetical protein
MGVPTEPPNGSVVARESPTSPATVSVVWNEKPGAVQ